MEIRKANLVVNKSGSGSSTFRATVPALWIREMGLSEDVRNITLWFDGETITIKNNKKGMEDMRKQIEMLDAKYEKVRERLLKAKAINLSHTRFSAKLNDKNAEFTQSEMQTIKDRYNLTPEEVDDIFFNYTVS